jgi:hypothetical protein
MSSSKFEYIDVAGWPPYDWWHYATAIVLCPRCSERFVEDPTRDWQGNELPRDPFGPLDDRTPSLCKVCLNESFAEALEADTLEIIEEKLGLTEENKKTLQALMSIIDNPDRVMMVARLHDRVDELERRLADRTDSLREVVESKLEGANTRLLDANSRLWVAMLVISACLFLLGLLVGVIVAFALGG